MSAGRDGITRKHLLLVIYDNNLRVQILLVLDDHGAHETRRFVYIAFDRNTRDHIAEFDLPTFVRENWHIIRIPLNESFSLLNCGFVAFGDHGTDDYVVTLKLPALGVMHAN